MQYHEKNYLFDFTNFFFFAWTFLNFLARYVAENDKNQKRNGTLKITNKCAYCGKNYQAKKFHLQQCEDYLKLTFECNLCQKRFTTEEKLTLHVQSIHEHLKVYK